MEINVLDHVGFVRNYVYKTTTDSDLRQDLEQVGYLALVEAKNRFKDGVTNKFLSYAGLFVTGRIKQYLRDVVKKHSMSYLDYLEADTPVDIDLCEDIDSINKLDKINKYLNYTIRPHNADAFRSVYLNVDTIENIAKKQNITEAVVRLKAHNVKKSMIKYFKDLHD